ncbi:hypothetical protein T492DRAFT_880335 [Pavlovales sp. CCMP2436]|nr:hypothetical protein T492DRAFT_880335 [Pavlovales sp. CCMP2436]
MEPTFPLARVATVYDMADMTSVSSPILPWRGNHKIGAITADGKLHVTGSYFQNAPGGSTAHAHHAVWDVATGLAAGSTPTGSYEMLAPMLHPRGAHACEFLADGNMYCVGGGFAQADHFTAKMQIYDPTADEWRLGPSAPTARDHVLSFTDAGKKTIKEGDLYSVFDLEAAPLPEPCFYESRQALITTWQKAMNKKLPYPHYNQRDKHARINRTLPFRRM